LRSLITNRENDEKLVGRVALAISSCSVLPLPNHSNQYRMKLRYDKINIRLGEIFFLSDA
jgi:hypothetical protein